MGVWFRDWWGVGGRWLLGLGMWLFGCGFGFGFWCRWGGGGGAPGGGRGGFFCLLVVVCFFFFLALLGFTFGLEFVMVASDGL